MAIISLLEATPEDQIFDLGEEVGRPEFVFPKDPDFGIGGQYGDYDLEQVKYAGRTGTEADGEYSGKVIKYKKWNTVDTMKYARTFWGACKNYIDYKSLSKFKAGKELTFDDIKQNYLDIQEVICDALRSSVEYGDIKKVCALQDVKSKLLIEINTLREELASFKKIKDDIDKMYNEIKEKRKIIVEVDKPKKFKAIKEEND